MDPRPPETLAEFNRRVIHGAGTTIAIVRETRRLNPWRRALQLRGGSSNDDATVAECPLCQRPVAPHHRVARRDGRKAHFWCVYPADWAVRPVIRCKACSGVIAPTEGRFHLPDGPSYHVSCYDAILQKQATAPDRGRSAEA